ncbi:aspartate/glutamate racemase family protein [uncultured Litoreibacter sp.]|uniref:aspartate/glutamate racemase family protein n=1 Tax=uncultured Litoreibacter sp. TaxID=1392394 RepID=UPI0026358A67|nr:aspartate/glutamate racemase family protein [uncultured Litoreibacter sp.]
MHIGLIGGIGPAATVVYYQRLTDLARKAGEHIDITIAHASVQDLIKNNLADDRASQAKIYARHIDSLKAAGADCVAITSLGGHYCFDETVPMSSLPLISAVAPLDNFFTGKGLKRIGLLGTEVVMRTKLYGQLTDLEAVAPNEDLNDLGATYRDVAVTGVCTDTQRDRFFAAGREMIDQQGADAVVLAGTDLNLAFDNNDPGYPVFDALDVHVGVLFDIASGRSSLNAHAQGI